MRTEHRVTISWESCFLGWIWRSCFIIWVASLNETLECRGREDPSTVIRQLSQAAIHMVSAWACDQLAAKVDDKSNEIRS